MKLSFTVVVAFMLSLMFFTANAQVAYTRYQKHEVQEGETAAQIAKNFNITLMDFCLLNDFPENVKLKEGQIVLIRTLKPGEMEVEENLPAKKERKIVRTEDAITYEKPAEKVETKTTTTTKTVTKEKTVVTKEAVEAPAEKKVVKSEPARYQPVGEEKPGVTPASTKAVEVGPGGTQYKVTQSEYHVVAKGQTFYRIALIYGLTVQELQQLNGLSNTTIEIGQKLKVRK